MMVEVTQISIHKIHTIGGARQRPRREDGKRRVFALHTAQTRPTPRFRSLHEVCTQGIPLHVANDLGEVVFCFHRETLVTPLIVMAVPDLVTMLLPPFHMRVGHLLHERGMAVTFHLRLRTLHFASRGLGSLGRGRSLSVTRP